MAADLDGWNLSIRTSLLPKATNQHGTIFGGVILSYLDIAGAIEAKRLCGQEVVTVAMKEVIFKEPVLVGDLVSFYTRIVATGRTSITTEIMVISTRETKKGGRVMVTVARVAYVAIDKDRKAMAFQPNPRDFDPPAFSKEYLERKG